MNDKQRKAMYAKKKRIKLKSSTDGSIKKKSNQDISYREKINRLQKKMEELSFDIWVLEALESKDAQRIEDIPNRTDRQWDRLFKLEKDGGSSKLKERRKLIESEMDEIKNE